MKRTSIKTKLTKMMWRTSGRRTVVSAGSDHVNNNDIMRHQRADGFSIAPPSRHTNYEYLYITVRNVGVV